MREPVVGLPRLHRWLLAAAARIVPRRLRDGWRREWEGEIAHRALRIAQLPNSGAGRRELAGRAGGAIIDAAWLFQHELRQGFLVDVRQGLRGLVRRPAFTLFILLTFALGIGANTALFSIVNGVLLKPLPFDEPGRLVVLWETSVEQGIARTNCSPGDFQYWRDHNEIFSSIAAWYRRSLTVQTEHDAVMHDAAQVSAGYFEVLGTPPHLGRTFTRQEADRAVYDSSNTLVGEGPVAMLSHRLWRQRFGSDPGVVGRTMTIERKQYEIVGVMPPGFLMPAPEIDLWVPWSFAHDRPRDQRYVNVLARLRPGLSVGEAQARLTALAEEMGRLYPDTNLGWAARLTPLHEEMVGSARPALLVLFAAVGCVLLIVCINVAGLLLVRATGRQHEIAVRSAMGASRVRLVRQFLIESFLLSFTGAALGLAAATWTIGALKTFGPTALPRLHELTLDSGVLLFTIGVAALAGLLSGLVPALAGSRAAASRMLASGGSRTATASPGRQRLRNILVVSEIAVATLLLAASGLLVRSLERLTHVDPGFRTENVLVFPIILDGASYGGERSRNYYAQLVRNLSALPGVEAAGGATVLPLSPVGPDFHLPVWREGTAPPEGGRQRADVRIATTGFFDTLGMTIVGGRSFTAEDHPDAPRRVIINKALARRHWGDADPVGRRLMIDYSTAGTYAYEIVGVVNDVRFYGPRSAPRPEVYLHHAQRPYLIVNMAVRARSDHEALIPAVRRAVLDLDPGRPVHSVVPLSDYLGESIERDRFATLVLSGFASVALALAAIGVYGVLSLRVSQRRHEIGVRMALGAGRADLLLLFVGQGARLVAAGLGLGIAAALLLTRLLSGLLFGVAPSDPLTFLVAASLLGAVGLAACWMPARRAALVNPLTALRHI